MDEEPGAVIHRLLEDGDVQIIDPPPPPSPLSANVVCSKHCTTSGEFRNSRRFAAQPSCAHKKQEIRNSAPGCLTSWVLGGSKTQEIRNPAPGFLISWVLAWISYFQGFGRPKTQEIRNPALISWVWAGPKTQFLG